jgi:hypothetical protein
MSSTIESLGSIDAVVVQGRGAGNIHEIGGMKARGPVKKTDEKEEKHNILQQVREDVNRHALEEERGNGNKIGAGAMPPPESPWAKTRINERAASFQP